MGEWAIAVTWPLYERRVARALVRDGYDCYLPKFKTRRRRTALLFPRYIFAGPAEEWRELREVHGVSRLLRSGDHPATIPDECVKALRAREDAHGFIKLPAKPKFTIGQRVRITLGAFTGLVGIYKGSSRHGHSERISLVLGDVVLPAGNLVAD